MDKIEQLVEIERKHKEEIDVLKKSPPMVWGVLVGDSEWTSSTAPSPSVPTVAPPA